MMETGEGDLNPQVARFLISIKLPQTDEDRVNELSAKARAGSLNEEESQELDNYLHAGYLLGVMQAKARRLLAAEAERTQSSTHVFKVRARLEG